MAKARSTARRTKPPEKLSPQNRDLIGIGLCTMGLVSLLCLLWRQGGVLPDYIEGFLRLVAGSGAYIVPFLLLFAGVMVLRGYQHLSLTRSTIGSVLLFLVFVGWRHVQFAPQETQWTSEVIMRSGGWMGAMMGASLRGLFGNVISYVILASLGVVGVIFIVDRPVWELVQHLRHGTSKGVTAVRAALDAPSKREALPSGEAIVRDVDRENRAQKVAERALKNRAGNSQEMAPVTIETAEVSPTLTRAWNLLNPNHLPAEEEAPPPTETQMVSEVPKPKSEKNARNKPAETAPTEALALDFAKEQTAPDEPAKPYVLPPITLLKETPPAVSKRTQEELADRIRTIEQTLEQFNIEANVLEVASGPSVTRYEVQLGPGIKVSKIVSLADNLAMSLAAIDVRVEAPIPGKAAIGVEVPNAQPQAVSLRECIETEAFQNAPSKLTVALGKDVAGQYKYADLTRMPHLLIGGSTNSGKSVCLNTLIASLVYRATPREVRLLMIDPKRVELSLWEGIPHLLHPVVKDVKQSAGVFKGAIKEMERRYDLFAALGTRNIDGYNQKVPEGDRLPFIVLIVDELADLMMQMGAEVETQICRLAQLARATGIHLVIATQRPSVDIITGTIKANISSRIAFAVASQIDSRTILDSPGAERLIGRGDMLFMPIDAPKPLRIQGCYLSEGETNTLVTYLREQEKPEYSFTIGDSDSGDNSRGGYAPEEEVDQELFEQAVRLVVNNGQASTSMIQRRFRIGYTRAARIVEMMEKRGIVGPLDGARPREIMISKVEMEQMFNPGYTPILDDPFEEEDE
jgi:S-DNA-T family DNA segregation ATPase FtsK/SpoIIIE